MNNSENAIKELAACGHEVKFTIDNLGDLLAASSFDKSDLSKAITGADCPLCCLIKAKETP